MLGKVSSGQLKVLKKLLTVAVCLAEASITTLPAIAE